MTTSPPRDPLERVTNLLALLLETKGPLTLDQIVHAVPGYPDKAVARRGAFERDKAMLRDIGVPIETEVLSGREAGQTAYRIDRARYELSGLELDEDERHALQLAVATVRSEVGQVGVWKLGGSMVGASSLLAGVPELDQLPVLRAAAGGRHPVAFVYRDRSRRLDPYGLLLRNGFWYVVGHDHEHGEVRTFRVDRIDGDVTIDDAATFERPDGFDAQAAFPSDPKLLGDGESVEASVLVDEVHAPTVRREFGDDAVREERADGSVVVVVPTSNLDAFRSWVVGFGEHAEVLGPPEVRADFVAWLRTTAGVS